MSVNSPSSSFSTTNGHLKRNGPITLEEARLRAHDLSHYNKRLKLATFITHRLSPFKVTCAGVEKDCIQNCSVVSIPKLSFVSLCDSSEVIRNPVKLDLLKCAINYGLTILETRTNSELNQLIDVVIDLEVVDRMVSVSTELVVVHVLRKAQHTLINAIRFIWSTVSTDQKLFYKNVSSLCVEDISPRTGSSDEPSIKMALCNFILHVKARFSYQEYQLHRLSRYFLLYLNNYIMPITSAMLFEDDSSDHVLYQSYYARWLATCIIPDSCSSFLKCQVMDIFGYHYLRLIYPHFCKVTLDRLKSEQNSLERKNEFSLGECFIKYFLFPEFMLYLEKEFIFASDATQLFWSISSDEATKVIDCMFGLVLTYEPLPVSFNLSVLEDAHFKLTRLAKLKFDSESTDFMNESFSWTNYLLEEGQQLLMPPKMHLEGDEAKVPASLPNVTIQAAIFLLNQSSNMIPEQFESYLLGKDIANISPFASELKRIGQQLAKDKELPQTETASATIFFRFIQNHLQQDESDKNVHELFWLLELLDLINAALPRMGRGYIARMLFDPRQQSLMLLKRNSNDSETVEGSLDLDRNLKVMGGISYRPFAEQGFSEIVFVVISPDEQVKGYGTKMMNALKEHHCKAGILYLLTYADYRATEFFAKQGFSNQIRLDKKVYEGYIKDYQGAILMECQLNPLISYLEHRDRLCMQKAILLKLIEKQQENIGETLYQDETPFDIIPLSVIRKVAPASNFNASLADFENHSSELALKLKDIVQHLMVSPEVAKIPTLVCQQSLSAKANYSQLIPYPMDLNMISARIDAGYYKNIHLFQADVRRVFDNHRKYFGQHKSPHSVVMKSAEKLQQHCLSRMKALGLVQDTK